LENILNNFVGGNKRDLMVFYSQNHIDKNGGEEKRCEK
jgi:hypothetical protein